MRDKVMAKTAKRRHHWMRLRKNRKHYHGHWFKAVQGDRRLEGRALNYMARHPKVCNGACCACSARVLGYQSFHDDVLDTKTFHCVKHKGVFQRHIVEEQGDLG